MAKRKGGGTKDVGRPTPAQIELARIVADRHEITLPFGYELDGPWVRRFLDCFAYDPESELDVFRRVRNILQYAREGRSVADIARKLEIKPDQAEFIMDVLHDSGFDLAETVEEFDGDPEEASWRELEGDLARQVYEYS